MAKGSLFDRPPEKVAPAPSVPIVAAPIGLPDLPDLAKINEILESNFDGLKPEFSVVKVPSGGGSAFEIPTDTGEPDIAKELTGVILDHYPARAYWTESYSGSSSGVPPACSSLDGKVGQGDPGGDCAKCPHNQWGTGKNGRGKACQEKHRLFILRGDSLFPLMLSAPPTSIKAVSVYATKIAGRLKKLGDIMTKIKLVKDKNQEGIEYSKLELFRIGDLNEDDRLKVNSLAAALKTAMRQRPMDVDAEFKAEDENVTFP